MAKQTRPLPHEIRDAKGRLKYRAGAMVSEIDFDAIVASHVPQTDTANESPIAAPEAEQMPFVPGAWAGEPPHEKKWREDQMIKVQAERLEAEHMAAKEAAPNVAPAMPAVPVAPPENKRDKKAEKLEEAK